jgi:HAD superfamily hydrolase (TIGR01509 family)
MIKVIIFDLWNTLQYKRYKKGGVRWMWKRFGKKIPYRKILKSYERNFQLDESDDFEKKYKNMFRELKLPYDDEAIKKYALYRKKMEAKGHIYSYTVPLLKLLRKKGYKIALLSNITHFHARRLIKLKINKCIDKFFFSFRLGSLKPKLRNFKKVLAYFDVKPREALMIGDSYHDDIVPTRKLGMKAIQFKGGNELKKELRRMKIL